MLLEIEVKTGDSLHVTAQCSFYLYTYTLLCVRKKRKMLRSYFPMRVGPVIMSQFSFQFFAAMNQRLHAAFLKRGGRSETTFSTGGPIWRGSNLL